MSLRLATVPISNSSFRASEFHTLKLLTHTLVLASTSATTYTYLSTSISYSSVYEITADW